MLRRLYLLLVFLMVVPMLVVACNSSPAPSPDHTPTSISLPEPTPTSEPAPPPEPASLPQSMGEVKAIVVGSKQYTEQQILGTMAVIMLEAAGYEVVDKTALGTPQVVRQALENDEIDLYWEYTGTALAVFHGVADENILTNPIRAYAEAASRDEILGLTWLAPAEFNDTYTLMVTQSTLDQGITTIEELANFMNVNGAPLRLCVEPQFFSRHPDGLTGLQEYYGFAFQDKNIALMELGDIYQALREGRCDVAEGFSTDGRIAAWGLVNLDDSRAFFPNYVPAPIVRQEVLAQYPELDSILSAIGPHLDDATMTELNARVDIGPDSVPNSGDEASVESVARFFLCKVSLLNDCPPSITIGSKGSTEQLMLGEMLHQVLDDSGFLVVNEIDLGDSQPLRQALENDEIDLYWEYTTTALADLYGITPINIALEDHKLISKLDKPSGFIWLTPAAFSNTDTLITTQDIAAQGITTLEDLADFMNTNDMALRFCATSEFVENSEGLPFLQVRYGMTFQEENIILMAQSDIYQALRDGVCDIALGLRTDGHIAAWGFVGLDDLRAGFPVNSPAPVVRQEVLAQHPELADILNTLGPYLNATTMSKLKARVDIGPDGVLNSGDEETVKAVVRDFLNKNCISLTCPQIIVGSKRFTEGVILGEIIIQVLEQQRFNVVDKLGLGGTQAVRQALDNGAIDLYWEYTGTALTNFHDIPAQNLPTDYLQSHKLISFLDEPLGFKWLAPAPFNDTFTLMVTKDLVDQGITSIEELASFMNANDAPLRFCGEAEFIGRSDGLSGLQELYDFAFLDQNIVLMEIGDTYQALREGRCEVAEGFSTDGRIAAWELVNLEDPQAFFPIYSPAPVIRQDMLTQYPELDSFLSAIGPHLDAATITDMNARVDIGRDGVPNSGDEESVETVAQLFLCDVGLMDDLSNCPTIDIAHTTKTVDTTSTTNSIQPDCEQIVTNSDFETDQDWALPTTSTAAFYTSDQTHSGDQSLQLGIIGDTDQTGYSAANLQVAIPEEATAANLSFWYYPISHDLVGGDYQGVFVYDEEFSFVRRQLQRDVSNEQAWRLMTYDLNAFIGESINLHFLVVNDGDGLSSGMYLDDVQLDVCFGQDR